MHSSSAAADSTAGRLLASAAAHYYAVRRDYDLFASPLMPSVVEAVGERFANSSLNGTTSVTSIEVGRA